MSPVPASLASTEDDAYFDVILQIQACETSLLAQVLEAHPMLLEPYDVASLGTLVRLERLEEVLQAAASLPEALHRMIFGSGDLSTTSIGSWLRKARKIAKRHERGLRLRLQVNPSDNKMLPRWSRLREVGILEPLDSRDAVAPDRAERERDEVVDWALAMPWESILDVPTVDDDAPISLVRTLPRTVRLDTREISDHGLLRVLLAWASPVDLVNTGGRESIPLLRQRVASFAVVEEAPSLTFERLRELISLRHWDIIHILAHGAAAHIAPLVRSDVPFCIADGQLFLETENHQSRGVAGYLLAEMLTHSQYAPPELVVLQVCDSGTVFGDLCRGIAQQLITAGVEYVVAMQAAIGVVPASEFTEKLYKQLSYWRSVDDAMSSARTALRRREVNADFSENTIVAELRGRWAVPLSAVPVLYMRKNARGRLRLGSLPQAIWGVDGKVMLLVEPGGDTPAFYIDKYPVTSKQYLGHDALWTSAFAAHPDLLPILDDLPAVGMGFDGAKSYAARYEKQLPTQEHWLAAQRTTSRQPAAVVNSDQCNTLRYWKHGMLTRPTAVTHFEMKGDQSEPTIQDMLGNCEELVLGPSGEGLMVGGSYCFDATIVPPATMLRPRPIRGMTQNYACFRTIIALDALHRLLQEHGSRLLANRTDTEHTLQPPGKHRENNRKIT